MELGTLGILVLWHGIRHGGAHSVVNEVSERDGGLTALASILSAHYVHTPMNGSGWTGL